MWPTKRIIDLIRKVKSRYDADFDIDINAPVVTWANYQSIELIEKLLERIEDLENRIKKLEA